MTTELAAGDAVFVETAARLHFGVLDLRGASGRWFGGIGAAAPSPTLLVSAAHADTLEIEGADTERAADFARRVLRHYGVKGGVHIRVHRTLPSHAGLGSGTQLGLAIARALTELQGIAADVPSLALATGRAGRSAIGTWTFADGGLVVEGGRPRASEGAPHVGPLIARLPFPPAWRCVLAVPDGAAGMNGAAESAAFAGLPPPSEPDVERIAHLVLMGLLPALAEANLAAFGAALNTIQTITGRWFASVQGGKFAPGPSEALVRGMTDWGAVGVGQSSWGPAVYGIVDGEHDGVRLADRVRTALAGAGQVYEGPFRPEGARVWRAKERAGTHEPGASTER